MECEIEIGGEGEPISGFERGMRTLGTDRKCDECERGISAGAEHEVATGDLDGEPFEVHTCMDCHNIAAAFQSEGRDYGYLWMQLEETGGEDFSGAFEHFNSGCLKNVETVSAKAYLQERYLKWKGLA